MVAGCATRRCTPAMWRGVAQGTVWAEMTAIGEVIAGGAEWMGIEKVLFGGSTTAPLANVNDPLYLADTCLQNGCGRRVNVNVFPMIA